MKINYVEVKKISDNKWDLSFFESNNEIPFDIKRVYYIYNLKENWTSRWKHAHFDTDQVLFCINWSVVITLDDWNHKESIKLDSQNKWIVIPKMIWHTMSDFTDNCIMLVVASKKYNEDDYIRNYVDFKKIN